MARFLINLIVSLVVIITLFGMYLEANATETWTKETQKKMDELVKIGIEPTFARSIMKECKRTAKNPIRCIKLGVSIAGAESSMGWRCFKNNCTWMGWGSIDYPSIYEGAKDWVRRYNLFWYNQKNPNGFYPLRGQVSPTRYCTDEHSSGSKKGCPNGNKHAWTVWNSISF